ncbi:MAG TPA: hypothetical protein VFS11_09010 [Gemmatimonadales bacterium]|nr:hypothetical protein [Gemmatimonadales bacterium]
MIIQELLFLAGAVALPAAGRRLALVGAVPILLGAAAEAARPGGDARTLAVNAGLVLLGLLLGVAGALAELRRNPRAAAPGAILLLGAAGGTLWSLGPAMRAAGAWPPVAVAILVGGAAAVVCGIGHLLGLGRWVRRLDAVLFGSGAAALHGKPIERGTVALALVMLIGLAAAWVGPHVALVFGGAFTAVAAAERYRHGYGAPAFGVAATVAFGVALGAAYWLLATIAGPVGLALDRLAEVPLSPAAEVAVAILIVAAVWLAFALFPLHTLAPGFVGSVAGAAVWLRVGVPAAPHGLAHWQALIAPLAVVATWYGAAAARPQVALRGLALLALASLAPGSARGALLLLAAAGALRLEHRVARGAAAILAGYGALVAFEAGLRAQVVYTVLAAAALALAAWTTLADNARERNLPTTPATLI